MQITFNPDDQADVDRVLTMLGQSLPCPAVPTDAANNVPPPGVGVELDDRGCPWIEEVHAGTRAKNQDGTWRRKRGVDADHAEKTEQDAIAEMKRIGDVASAVSLPEPPADPEPAPVADPAPLGAAPTPVPDPAPLGAPAPVVAVSMDQLNDLYISLCRSGAISSDKVQAGFFAAHGIDPGKLVSDGDQRARMFALISDPEECKKWA